VSCNSRVSTRWAELDRKSNLPPNKKIGLVIESLDIDYKNARRVTLLGGEPLFDPKTFKILKNLADNNNTDCFISLVTNGSIKLNPSQIELFKKFTDLNICISIDGTESAFEYLRWPGNWENLLENLNHYRNITTNISISYTISSLNALYYDQTVQWFNKNNLQYNHNVVESPNWLSVKNMPIKFKELLKNHYFFKQWCDINGDEIKLSTLSDHVLHQDQLKKISIRNYMPEVADLIFNTGN
jgi:MoaA/NifB/PqqE/SkfB family radical SAM enzyme